MAPPQPAPGVSAAKARAALGYAPATSVAEGLAAVPREA